MFTTRLPIAILTVSALVLTACGGLTVAPISALHGLPTVRSTGLAPAD